MTTERLARILRGMEKARDRFGRGLLLSGDVPYRVCTGAGSGAGLAGG